ncbi:MAG: hypothetical protein ACR2QK_07410 [Acidimicrobiales bacterium]
MHSLSRSGRKAGIAFALALLASACSSESTPITAASESSSSQTSSSDAGSSETSVEADAGAQGAGAESAGSDTPAEEQEAEGPAPADNHLFPDLTTVNISDGSTLNLAEELAGGDTPVLLWFYAPH